MAVDRTGTVLLEFDPSLNKVGKKKQIRHGLSAVVQIGDTLWVTNDETISLERLSRSEGHVDGTLRYGEHRRFELGDFLELPAPPAEEEDAEEADVEGLDFHDGHLWLVGSHSWKRAKAKEDKSAEKNRKRLEEVTADGNRFLLARIPADPETLDLTGAGARLRGDHVGDEITAALAEDEHLGAFLPIPGKDNGFDIEGLAVSGSRVLVGLRGPVLRGWAVILELEPELDGSDLTLKAIGPKDRRYRKHFLQLGGLGVRDLCVQGSDLLIMAGPTMDLDGPVTIVRWPGGAEPDEESVLFESSLCPVAELPVGRGADRGRDHPEGMTLFAPDGGDARAVLVVYDSAAEGRLVDESAVRADVFELPG